MSISVETNTKLRDVQNFYCCCCKFDLRRKPTCVDGSEVEVFEVYCCRSRIGWNQKVLRQSDFSEHVHSKYHCTAERDFWGANLCELLLKCKLFCHTSADETFQIDTGLSYRYGNIFREAIRIPRFEWCSAVNDMSVSPYLHYFYEAMKSTSPQLFQKCPFKKVSSYSLFWNHFKEFYATLGIFKFDKHQLWSTKSSAVSIGLVQRITQHYCRWHFCRLWMGHYWN